MFKNEPNLFFKEKRNINSIHNFNILEIDKLIENLEKNFREIIQEFTNKKNEQVSKIMRIKESLDNLNTLIFKENSNKIQDYVNEYREIEEILDLKNINKDNYNNKDFKNIKIQINEKFKTRIKKNEFINERNIQTFKNLKEFKTYLKKKETVNNEFKSKNEKPFFKEDLTKYSISIKQNKSSSNDNLLKDKFNKNNISNSEYLIKKWDSLKKFNFKYKKWI